MSRPDPLTAAEMIEKLTPLAQWIRSTNYGEVHLKNLDAVLSALAVPVGAEPPVALVRFCPRCESERRVCGLCGYEFDPPAAVPAQETTRYCQRCGAGTLAGCDCATAASGEKG